MKTQPKMLSPRATTQIRLKRKIHRVLTRLGLRTSAASDPKALNEVLLTTRSGALRPFHFRNSHADIEVIRQIFADEDYSLARLRRESELNETYQAILASGKTPLILDCGSNIGASCVWFSDVFPQAHIACFEPNNGNFAVLSKNVAGLNVEPHCAAIGSTTGTCAIVDPGEGEWGYRAEAGTPGTCPLVSMSEFVAGKVAAGYVPFIAKIDIEGGEADLFSQTVEWADAFARLIVELHDWLLPKEGTSHSFLAYVGSRNRDFIHIGENVFSIRN